MKTKKQKLRAEVERISNVPSPYPHCAGLAVIEEARLLMWRAEGAERGRSDKLYSATSVN